MPRRPRNAPDPGELAVRLGERIRQARQEKGWTQAAVSERLGMSPEAYGRIERGLSMPSFPTFAKLCDALGVSSDVLLDRPALPTEGGDEASLRGPMTGESDVDLRRLWTRMAELEPEALRSVALVVDVLWSWQGRSRH